jgi:glycosyltransferase involved in cell wall biosynthesis
MLTTPRSVRGARQIIAVSQFTKKEIIRVLRKNPDDIVVIPEAPDPQFNVINDRSRVLQIRQKFNISDEYILCLGSEDPNKNTITIIRAYERLRNVVGPRYILVIVGMKNSRRSILKKMVDELRLGEDVILEDVVSDADLVALYNAAELFVFPSLYEGFGFPPLEAMSCGTPVIASDAASIPEVVADAAILVQPLNVQGWTEAMYQVLSNQSLREELINKGFRRVREFSWENAAQRTLKVYEEACKVE